MFLLYNIVGWAISELGLADEFVRVVEVLCKLLGL